MLSSDILAQPVDFLRLLYRLMFAMIPSQVAGRERIWEELGWLVRNDISEKTILPETLPFLMLARHA